MKLPASLTCIFAIYHEQRGCSDRPTNFVRLVSTGLAIGSLRANAQQTGKIYRIGYLAGGSAAGSRAFVEEFREGLREHGWVEGQNFVIGYRFAEGRFDRLPALAAELVRLKVDIIAAVPTPAAVAAKNATETISPSSSSPQ